MGNQLRWAFREYSTARKNANTSSGCRTNSLHGPKRRARLHRIPLLTLT